MIPELSAHLRSIADQIGACVETTDEPVVCMDRRDAAQLVRQLKAIARSCDTPSLHTPIAAPLSPALLRRVAADMVVAATLTDLGRPVTPETLRMVAIHLHDAADTIDELRAHAARVARLRVVG